MRLPILLAFGFVASTACAENAPTFGTVYNQREDSSLTYTCTPQGAQRLRCDFIQTSITKKAKPEDLEKRLADARKAYPNVVKDLADTERCKMLGAILNISTGKAPIDTVIDQYPNLATDRDEFSKDMRQFRDNAKSNPDLLDVSRAVVDLCNGPSEDGYLKLTRAIYAKDLRTCNVWSRPFTQEFVWVSDYGKGGAWVVSAPPDGPCGLVQLSRFENENYQTDTAGLHWRYVARRAVTNPSGTYLPGFSCSAFDQSEFVYDWKQTRSDYMQCEFVKFSPF